jgi:hypothetical protein
MSTHIALSCAAFATIRELFVCLIDLLNEFEFWLALESQNLLASFIEKNVEGMSIEETTARKNVSMTSAETDEKMKILEESVDKKSGEQLLSGKCCDGSKARELRSPDNEL